MLLALDYDGTYTADPDLWLPFVRRALARGHNVICVTMRYAHEGATMDEGLKGIIPVYFTDRQAKIPFLAAMGIYPNIWIDNNPVWLFQNSI